MKTTDKLRNMASVILTQNEKVLLLYRQGSRIVNNLWVPSAGGHFEADELNEPRVCALRELSEELGLTEDAVEDLSLRYITLRNYKGEVRQNYYFFARLKDGYEASLSSNEGTLRWFAPEELTALQMPFSAKFMLDHYATVGKDTTCLYGGVSNGVFTVFTELQEG